MEWQDGDKKVFSPSASRIPVTYCSMGVCVAKGYCKIYMYWPSLSFLCFFFALSLCLPPLLHSTCLYFLPYLCHSLTHSLSSFSYRFSFFLHSLGPTLPALPPFFTFSFFSTSVPSLLHSVFPLYLFLSALCFFTPLILSSLLPFSYLSLCFFDPSRPHPLPQLLSSLRETKIIHSFLITSEDKPEFTSINGTQTDQ